MEERERLSFLDAIAKGYVENFDDLSEFIFVFPNKRSGTFFLKSLGAQAKGRTLLAPSIEPIAELVARLAQREPAPRIDLLFRLYNIYCGMEGSAAGKGRKHSGDAAKSAAKDAMLDFEAFRSWGEILLSDFSEVDQYGVDPDQIFKNVTDFREIASNFLTDDQVRVLEQYFGYTPSRNDLERFWKNLIPPKGLSDIKNRFLYMWQMMGPLYHALDEDLAKAGMALPGALYRLALERVRKEGKAAFDCKKIVFVGFNALSTTEALLFEEISKAGGFYEDERDCFVDFYWDGTGPVLNSSWSDSASFLRLNRKNFPSPDWMAPYLRACEVDKMPADIRVVASPSNSSQAKIAGSRVAEIVAEIGAEKVKDARVAVVLPDENLLMPLLHALPSDLNNVNLTMGYSLRLTSVSTFLHHLRQLHSRSRVKDDVAFYHEDLRLFLSHPFAHRLFGSRAVSALNTFISRGHKVVVTLSEITEVLAANGCSSEMTEVFDLRHYGEGRDGAIDYINDVLIKVDTAIAGVDAGVVKQRLDRSHIAVYRDALERLRLSAEEHNIELGLHGVFYLIDKLLAGEHVALEGEPLEGLQVMGLLETRALDFDHLVIPSLNDRIMPRKARHATFIPDSLRHGYGLPYSNYQESLFSYYFYRMISRAQSVTLIYDARSGEGMRSGGESRYLMQLRYLYARNGIRFENYRFMLSDNTSAARPVEKTADVMAKLHEFEIEGSRRNFSASALKKYMDCQVKFYLEVVENIRTDTDETEYINAITQGNIVHYVMLQLYYPQDCQRKFLDKRVVITEEYLSKLLRDTGRIRREVDRAINKEHFHLDGEDLDRPVTGSAAMVAGHLVSQIKDIITYDITFTPFHLAGGEMEGLYRWEFGGGRKVNMKYAIDRLDIVNPGEGEQWRIVDYKTGRDEVTAEDPEDIFNGALKAKNIFQLMLYANLMNKDLGFDHNVLPLIYSVGQLKKSGASVPKIGPKVVDPNSKKGTLKFPDLTGHKDINEMFISRLDSILCDIFDPTKPFMPPEEESHCRFCKLQSACGKG